MGDHDCKEKIKRGVMKMAEAKKRATILVVDDEHGVRQSFYMVLKDEFKVLLAESGNEAIDIFSRNAVDLILLDILLPDIDGITLLEKFMDIDPNTEVIMVTAVKEIQTAVKAIKLGAYEYIIKPFVVDDVISIIHRALEKHNLVKEVTYLKYELERYHPFEKMVGEDKNMKNIFVIEMNMGKLARELGRISGSIPIHSLTKLGGVVPSINEIYTFINKRVVGGR